MREIDSVGFFEDRTKLKIPSKTTPPLTKDKFESGFRRSTTDNRILLKSSEISILQRCYSKTQSYLLFFCWALIGTIGCS